MIQCKYSKSLGGGFDGVPNDAWKTVDYTDNTKPVVFCGMYDLRDYIALWRHRGKKWVFWCGSDILNLSKGFIFNDGKLKWLSKYCPGFKFILKDILKDAEHWVENHKERDMLLKWGIEVVYVAPSFFGDKENYELSYNFNSNPNVYISCGKDRQVEYGFGIIEAIAPWCPKIKFHLYGDEWETEHKNVIVHGRVPLDQMNEDIKNMQCGLRLNEFDGFSEILAKSVLMGHYAISKIKYPMIATYSTNDELISLLNSLTIAYKPNTKARDFYKLMINKFPWNSK